MRLFDMIEEVFDALPYIIEEAEDSANNKIGDSESFRVSPKNKYLSKDELKENLKYIDDKIKDLEKTIEQFKKDKKDLIEKYKDKIIREETAEKIKEEFDKEGLDFSEGFLKELTSKIFDKYQEDPKAAEKIFANIFGSDDGKETTEMDKEEKSSKSKSKKK